MQTAAIKKMDMQASREFLAELKVLTHVHHLNLVLNVSTLCITVNAFVWHTYINHTHIYMYVGMHDCIFKKSHNVLYWWKTGSLSEGDNGSL